MYTLCGPEVLFETCVAMKFVDDDDADDVQLNDLKTVPPHNLDTAARRFSVAALRLWNSLPLNCRTAPSVNTFKIRLKTVLFDSA